MIYFCVKNSEYLLTILSQVSKGTEFYKQVDVDQSKAPSLSKKWSARYNREKSAMQRYSHLKKQPVLDLIILQNRSLAKMAKVRLCLTATLPEADRYEYREQIRAYDKRHVADGNAQINKHYALDKHDMESFYSVFDHDHRLIFTTISDKAPPEGRKPDSLAIYELVLQTYTLKERKQSNITDTISFTWRLHRDFITFKQKKITDCYKRIQKNIQNKSIPEQDKSLIKEMAMIQGLVGTRGVRDDVFKINQIFLTLNHRYLNRPLSIDLEVPRYKRKEKRLASNLSEVLDFHKV